MSTLDFMDGGKSPYEILELTNGPEATDQEIRKAYRLQALKKHPDKNKDNPNAANEFAELEKAYRVLTDASARGALDDFLRAKQLRAERDAQRGDKRQKLREALEKREKQTSVARNEEELARARLRSELERLRKKAEDEQATTAAATARVHQEVAAARASEAAGGSGRGAGEELDEGTKEQLRRTVKVSWDHSTKEYTADALRKIFAEHGTVQDVVVKDRKSKRDGGKSTRVKSSALVIMSSLAEADRAAGAVCGDIDDPLLVVPLLKVAPDLHEGPAGPATAASPTSRSPTPPPLTSHTTHRSAGTGTGAGLSQAPAVSVAPLPLPTKPLFSFAGFGGASAAAAPTPASSLFPAAGAPTNSAASLFPTSGTSGHHTSGSNPGGSAPSGFSSFPSSFPAGFPGVGGAGGLGGAENAILEKMKRAADRERQLAALKAQEGKE